MIRMYSPSEFPGNKEFIIIPIVHGKGIQHLSPLLHFPGTYGTDNAGIQSSGQKGSQRHIGDHLPFDRIDNQFPDHFRGFLKGLGMLPVLKLPVSPQLQISLLIPAAAAGLNLPDPPEHAATRESAGTQHDQLRTALGIDLGPDTWIAEDRFDLRSKEEPAITQGIKQGFHTDPVPGQEQTLCLFQIHPEGKDSVHPLQHRFSPLGKAVKNHLRIRVALKLMAQSFQFPAQLPSIVQLPIIYQRVPLPGPGKLHWLLTALRIDDGQPGMEQRPVRSSLHPILIRTPAGHGGQHPLQDLSIHVQIQYPSDGTQADHILSIPVFYAPGKEKVHPSLHISVAGIISCFET